MKGVIFNIFSEFIEEIGGLEAWDKLLEQTELEGVYTSAGSYSDEELFALVGKACEMKGIAIPDALKAFGQFAVGGFFSRYPEFFEGLDCRQFFQSIHGVIHQEVLKLYPGAMPPEVLFEETGSGKIRLLYRSDRSLPDLAEGLILGTLKHFNIETEIRRIDSEGVTVFEMDI